MRGTGLTAAAALVWTTLAPWAPALAVPYGFNDPTGDLGTDFIYESAPPDGAAVIATGEDTRGPRLFGKNTPGNMGVGILGTMQSNGQTNEITPGFYVQLDLVNILPPPPPNPYVTFALATGGPTATSPRVGFRASGVEQGDVWAVFGTNTADIAADALSDSDIATFIASGTTADFIPDLGTDIIGVFRYLDITALSGGILVSEIDVAVPVLAPEPTSLAILGSAFLTFGVIWFRRRTYRHGLTMRCS